MSDYIILEQHSAPDGYDITVQLADGSATVLHDCDGQPDDVDAWVESVLAAQQAAQQQILDNEAQGA